MLVPGLTVLKTKFGAAAGRRISSAWGAEDVYVPFSVVEKPPLEFFQI